MPRLEIHADDVKCGHGTTIGRLDPEQLFYLRSRGIGEAAARRMLSLGFARAVIDAVEPAELREAFAVRLGDGLAEVASDDDAG